MKAYSGKIYVQQTPAGRIWLTIEQWLNINTATATLTPSQALKLAGQLQRLSWKLARTGAQNEKCQAPDTGKR